MQKPNKYAVVESKLKTDKTRKYLWNKINSPKKMIKIEGWDKDSLIKKISENNYRITSQKEIILLVFIPEKGVDIVCAGNKNWPLAWFEIKGEKNCEIIHGEYKKVFKNKLRFKRDVEWLKKHFLKELKEIAK